ncbi:MAG: hypothetical protein GXO21_08400, partial [Aquificae bacterium]|nr:hypothetical protein [Aquificota bacterium]
MKYTLTGNFQYDLGIYGLKNILDFFQEKYKTDNKFFLEIEKKPEEILELIVLKLISEKEINYFFNKLLDVFFKNKKNKEKILKDFLSKKNLSNEELKLFIKKEKNLEKTINLLTD